MSYSLSQVVASKFQAESWRKGERREQRVYMLYLIWKIPRSSYINTFAYHPIDLNLAAQVYPAAKKSGSCSLHSGKPCAKPQIGESLTIVKGEDGYWGTIFWTSKYSRTHFSSFMEYHQLLHEEDKPPNPSSYWSYSKFLISGTRPDISSCDLVTYKLKDILFSPLALKI